MNFVNPNRTPSEDIYGDIINLPHPEPKNHRRMEKLNRAAQFAPFAALTGYEDAVDETARLTGNRIEISEEKKIVIDRRIRMLIGELDVDEKKPTIIIYYLPDKYKEGGSYVSHDADVKRYNPEKDCLVMTDGKEIKVKDIFDIR